MKDYRLGWIESCVRYGGRFGPREKVVFCDIFNVSEASASRDQALFQSEFEAFQGQEIFKRTPEGRPLGGKLALRPDVRLKSEMRFSSAPSMDRWLEEMFGPGRFEQAAVMRKQPDPEVLRAVLQGIEDRIPVVIHYLSRKREAVRRVSPHVLVKVADRYHVRAFDHANNRPGDFVLSRILHAHLDSDGGSGFVGLEDDRGWNTFVEIRVTAKTNEDGFIPRGICFDFDLDEMGQKTLRVRRALVEYLIDDAQKGFTSPVCVSKLD